MGADPFLSAAFQFLRDVSRTRQRNLLQTFSVYSFPALPRFRFLFYGFKEVASVKNGPLATETALGVTRDASERIYDQVARILS